MSNFNFRLYGDQIYGLCSGYFNKYISPEINKEKFLTTFKEGRLKYEDIKLKQKMEIYPQITINSLEIKNLFIDIPDEKGSSLKINLNDVFCEVMITDITENQVKDIILKERKNLVEAFIKKTVDEIKKKEQSKSFLDSLIENLINQALNGFNITINDLKLNIIYKKSKFELIINNFLFDERGRIVFNKIFASYKEDSSQYTIVKEFDINILLTKNKEKEINILQINISDFTLELNQKIYFGLNNLINCLTNSSYQKLYYKYKTLIQYHRTKINNLPNGKKNYRALWLYAIRTIIKLQKYVGYDKRYIFNLLNSTQEKISKKYYKNKDNTENDIYMLYLSKLNLLKGSKEIVRQKLLDDKKGNALTNAFFSFFGGGKKEKEELTAEEIDDLNRLYKDENINNYLKEYESINIEDNVVVGKIKKIYASLMVYISVQKLELILSNQISNKNWDFYIHSINMELSHINNEINYKFNIFDICGNNNISIFKQKQSSSINIIPMIAVGKYLNNLSINFSFFNIELQEDDFIYLISFLCSIETPRKIKLFKPEEKENDINLDKKENNIKDNNSDNLFRDLKINHIPSLTLLCGGNKIDICFNDFILNETYFCFTLNIKDSFGEIFPDYTFMVDTIKKNNTYKFHLEMPIKLTLSKNSSAFFFFFYLKLQKVKNDNMNLNNLDKIKNNDNEQLFEFKYTSYLRLNMDDVKDIGLDFLIDKTEIEIYEEKCKSKLLINNLSLKYENKNINLNIGKISLITNKYSTIILYLFTFESPDYKEYEIKLSKYFQNQNKPNNLLDNQNINSPNEENGVEIIQSIDYINLFETLFDKLNMNLKLFNLEYKADNNITTLIMNNVQVGKQNKVINIAIQNCCLNLNIITRVKSTSTINLANVGNIERIVDIKEKILIDIDLSTGILNINVKNPLADINIPILQALDESFMFLLKQINLDYVICKLLIDINNTKVNFNQFNYLIENINIKNFTEVTQDTFFIKIRSIIMRNKNIEIIEEKEIDIDYQFKSSTENILTFKSTDIRVKIIQSDIYYLILSLKQKKEDNNEKDTENIITYNNTNTNAFFENNLTTDILKQINNNYTGNLNNNDFFGLNGDVFNLNLNNNETNKGNIENNNGIYPQNNSNSSHEENKINNDKILNNFFDEMNKNNFNNNGNNNENSSTNLTLNNSSMTPQNNNNINNYKKLILNLQIIANIPSINLCLCLNDYTKISEFSVFSTSFKINSITKGSDITSDLTTITEVDYQIFLGQLLLKYFDNNNNEIIMLNYEKSTKDNKSRYSHQIEIKYNKNDILININKNEIIVRADSFLALYYYFKGSLPINEIMDNFYQVEQTNKARQIQINFNDSKFQLQTSFDGSENLHLDINSFVILYNSFDDGLFPYGNIFVTLNTMSTTLISEQQSRKLFYTKRDFLYVQITNSKLNAKFEVRMGNLIINLSYSDIISFLTAYFLNETFFNDEAALSNEKFLKNLEELNKMNHLDDKNNNNIQSDSGKIIPLEYRLKEYSGKFNFQKLDITLIDNSTGNYYPFMNLILFENNFVYDKNLLDSSLSLILNSYNYISRVWEPTLEKVHFNLKYLEQNDATKSHRFIFDIDQILINLSDMSISFTLVCLNNWIKKFFIAQNAFKESSITNTEKKLIIFKSESSMNNITKITNNKVINYSGIDLTIKYANNEYKLKPLEEIALEYKNIWNVKQYGPKQIIILYDNNTRINIPIEKIITLNHIIDKDKNFFLVSDNILSKDRQMNITIYSPIIFKNKSRYSLQIKFENQKIGNIILNLPPDGIFGIPFNYYNKSTLFSFILINSKSKNNNNNNNSKNSFSSSFNLGEIMTTEAHQRYRKYIHLPNRKILLMKMKKQIGEIRTVLITCEYSIINCLPCDIFVETDERGLMVEKCSQQFIDFYAGSGLEMVIKIFANNEYFYSRKKKLFEIEPKKEGNYLKFKNESNTQSFRLTLNFKISQNERAVIIYAESILHNNSGILFDIKSKNKNKSKKTKTQLCFRINDNLFLMSSKISNSVKDSYFMLLNNIFQSKKIKLQEVMEASPYYKLIMNSINMKDRAHDYILALLIKKRMSYLNVENNPNFKENIMSIIYCILPICRITNLLKDKNFLIQDAIDKTKVMLVPPNKSIDFSFFNRGINTKLIFGISEPIKNSPYQMSNNEFTFINYGIYTFCIGKTIFNIEIRESAIDGIIDMFIVETNLENAKIIVENLTDINLKVYQIGYEINEQNIKINEKQILRVYDQNNPQFIFEIGNKASTFEFTSFEEEQSETPINNNIILFKESNGIKMNLKFYKVNVFNQFKSKISTLYFNFKINSIYISMIGDNEDKNKRLDDYKRHEIMLFYLNGFNCSINWEQNLGLLGKDIVTFNIALDKCELYNQLNQKGKFSLVFTNVGSPFIFLLTEMFYFKNGKVAKINKFEFIITKISLYIDPIFINEILNFFQNIIYRMKIRNFNVDSVFLSSSNQNKDTDEEDVYISDNVLCYGYNFDFPPLKIDFEITNFGLDQLLKQKLGCSFFFVWLANGLCGKKTSINVVKGQVSDFVGKINGALKTMISYYKSKIIGDITSIGIKGFVGNFTKIFNFISSDKSGKEIWGKRKRPPRAFYGKYKYFKTYNEIDSIYFEKIEVKHSHLMNKLYYKNIIKGIKKVYLFTDSRLIVLFDEDLEIFDQIKYHIVKNIREDKNNILINLNQKFDGKDYYKIECEDKTICHKVCKIFQEEVDKITDVNN